MASKPYTIRLTFNRPASPTTRKRKSKIPPQPTILNQRENLTLPEDWTVGNLKSEALRLFHKGTKASQKKVTVNLLVGYPPTLLEEKKNEVLARSCISSNESIIVRFVDKLESNKKKQSKVSPNKITSDSPEIQTETNSNNNVKSNQSINPNPQKRRAAIEASSNFIHVIKAQDALIKSEANTKSRTNKTKSKQTSTKSKNKPTYSNPKGSRIMAQHTGRKLSDGSLIPPTTQNGNKLTKASFKDETDVATRLLTSLESGGGGTGKIGSFLRGAMKNAVLKSYEVSKASARIAAVQSRQFRIVPKENINVEGTDTDTSCIEKHEKSPLLFGIYTVQYSKGKVSNERGMHKEDFQLISLSTLKSVIHAVYNDPDPQAGGKEMLRARNMAQLSPRVFWSIAYHTMSAGSHVSLLDSETSPSPKTKRIANDTEEGLQILLPDLDWKYLRGRTKTLSEKAKENLRQKQKKAKSNVVDDITLDKGIEVVDAVEEAMAKVITEDAILFRERAARAALGRLDNKLNQGKEMEKELEDRWTLKIPSEEDWDELKECVSEAHSLSSKDIHIYIQTLNKVCGVRNWRELANEDKTIIRKKLLTICVDNTPTEEDIDIWIDAAQKRSIDEIMMEICDFNEEAVVALREEARTATPKDLALWKPITNMLLKEIKKGIYKMDDISETLLHTWCNRSKILLEQYEWLNWYATPIA